jgi:hypothetical protein
LPPGYAMHRSTLVVLSCVVWAVAGCREKTTFRPAFDGGLTCEGKERLVNGECRFVCERDPDCPTGERCNLLTGTCQAKPPPVEPADIPCTTGAERCRTDNKAVERCGEDGKWQATQTCAGNGYCVDAQCKACQPFAATCVSGDPKAVTVCSADGNGTRTIRCTGASICSQGECRECAPNTTRCSGDNKTVQICQRTSDETAQWKWVNNGDGFDGLCITQTCEQVASNQARCKAAACIAPATQCKDTKTLQVCSTRGAWEERLCTAQPGMTALAECYAGACIDECAEAQRANPPSYFGCDYWTAISDNSMDPLFKGRTMSGQGTTDSIFAFVAANRSELPTVVEVWRHFGGAPQKVKSVTLEGRSSPSKGLGVIYVPWQSIGAADVASGISVTGLQKYAYRVKSSRPITLYQFNPLDAVKPGKTCTAADGPSASCNESAYYNPLVQQSWGECRVAAGTTERRCHYFTFSNDASLLLPAHILGDSYVVMTNEHMALTPSDTTAPNGTLGSHMVVVAPEDGTVVTIKSSAKTAAGGSVPAFEKGQSTQITLNSFDVLQIATVDLGANYITCAANPWGGLFDTSRVCRVDNDLTGTIVTSNKPIAVFGGAACTIRPFDKAACDHIEEQIFPFKTWGKEFVAQKSHPLRLSTGSFATPSQMAPDHWKIVAGCPQSQCPNGTLVKFSTPPAAADVLLPNRCVTGSIATNDCRLLGGQHMEFKSKASFTITADFPIMVGQFFAGQQATTGGFLSSSSQGDPSFVLLPPVEQWRASYTVLAAPAIRDNYLALVYDESKVSSVLVDGVAVTGFTVLSGSTFRVKNHPVSVGSHTVQIIPKPGLPRVPGVGVTAYGYDAFVSYGYTGGLDLGAIVTGINPGG